MMYSWASRAARRHARRGAALARPCARGAALRNAASTTTTADAAAVAAGDKNVVVGSTVSGEDGEGRLVEGGWEYAARLRGSSADDLAELVRRQNEFAGGWIASELGHQRLSAVFEEVRAYSASDGKFVDEAERLGVLDAAQQLPERQRDWLYYSVLDPETHAAKLFRRKVVDHEACRRISRSNWARILASNAVGPPQPVVDPSEMPVVQPVGPEGFSATAQAGSPLVEDAQAIVQREMKVAARITADAAQEGAAAAAAEEEEEAEEAADSSYAMLGLARATDDMAAVAYAVDRTGEELFDLEVRLTPAPPRHDLKARAATQAVVPNVVNATLVGPGLSEAACKRGATWLYYTRAGPSRRADRAFRRRLAATGLSGTHDAGSIQGAALQIGPEEEVVAEEGADGQESAFFVDVARSKDGALVSLNLNDRTTSEVSFVRHDSDAGSLAPIPLVRRDCGGQLFVEHAEGFVYVMTSVPPEACSDLSNEHRVARVPEGATASNMYLLRRPLSSFAQGDDEAAGAVLGAEWEAVLGADTEYILEDMDMYADWPEGRGRPPCVLLKERSKATGRPRLRVVALPGHEAAAEAAGWSALPEAPARRGYEVPLPLDTVAVDGGANGESEALWHRITVESTTAPPQTMDLDMGAGELCVLDQISCARPHESIEQLSLVPDRVRAIMRGWIVAPNHYSESGTGDEAEVEVFPDPGPWPVQLESKLLFAGDVPITYVQAKERRPHRNGEDTAAPPLLLTMYGSYGHRSELEWEARALPLLRRGWAVACAHIRGGGELGTEWYEAGRRGNKWRAIQDTVDAANYLVDQGFTARGRIVTRSHSAGAVPAAAAAIQNPDLFGGMIMYSPFATVVSGCVSDADPLASMDRQEWGDPRDPTLLDAIRAIDPDSMLKPGMVLPPMLMFSGANDPRVPLWQQMQWLVNVQLASQAVKQTPEEQAQQQQNPYLMQTTPGVGHFGSTDPSQYLGDLAQEVLFAQWCATRSWPVEVPELDKWEAEAAGPLEQDK